MNNKIREKQLNKVLYGLDYIGNKIKNDGKLELGINNCKLLLDYIDNLQQEITRLKERSYINLERNIEAYKIVEDYESRIDKAVKYIKKHILKYDVDGSIGDFDEFDILIRPSDLLDILQNGGDKDE